MKAISAIRSIVACLASFGAFFAPRIATRNYPDPKGRRAYEAKHRSRRNRSRGWMIRHQRKVEAAQRGGPGKINYRRSDPRHGMYDIFRKGGLRVCWKTPAGGVVIRNAEGDSYSPLEAFRALNLPIPKALLRAA